MVRYFGGAARMSGQYWGSPAMLGVSPSVAREKWGIPNENTMTDIAYGAITKKNFDKFVIVRPAASIAGAGKGRATEYFIEHKYLPFVLIYATRPAMKPN